MKLTGLHLLTTFQCNFTCDHCFVWGSPSQSGTMTLDMIGEVIGEADRAGVKSIYFEGGEPFLYHPVLVRGVQAAALKAMSVGVVTNGYWATDVEDAVEWLRPLAGRIRSLSVSSDDFHGSGEGEFFAASAGAAAIELGIPFGVIRIAPPEAAGAVCGQLPNGSSAVMYRGRAARQLAGMAPQHPWETFTSCPHEDLEDPGRLHVDPCGNLHVCQGICIGNLLSTPLDEICRTYDPCFHPVVRPLLQGGPAELARREGITPDETYADACHFCYELRLQLRGKYPEILGPDQMYGAPGDE